MKQFLVILLLTALGWIGLSMTETCHIPVVVSISYEGFDRNRYAVSQSDTTLCCNVETTRIKALMSTIGHRKYHTKISIPSGSMYRAIAIDDVQTQIKAAIGVDESSYLSCQVDSLRVTLSEREERRFKPSLVDVSLSFVEPYGLYGEPEVTPDEVIVYGPKILLDDIDGVKIAATEITGIDRTSTYNLSMDPIWEQHPELKVSTQKVNLKIPVAEFVERQISIPVSIDGADSAERYHIYPEKVTAYVWVAKQDLQLVSPLQYKVTIDCNDIVSGVKDIPVRLSSFPNNTRLRRLEPSTVQGIIVK